VRAGQEGVGAESLRQIRALRRDNLRQIGIVCHAERYWEEINSALSNGQVAFIRLNQRGERLDTSSPLVAVARPETIGGQEFDAVLAVGLEQGVVPPRVSSNQALSVALEQQALREMYVSFTRARYRLVLVNSNRSAPTAIIGRRLRRDDPRMRPSRDRVRLLAAPLASIYLALSEFVTADAAGGGGGKSTRAAER
jgi:superfamily I DNA/RNA helicase